MTGESGEWIDERIDEWIIEPCPARCLCAAQVVLAQVVPATSHSSAARRRPGRSRGQRPALLPAPRPVPPLARRLAASLAPPSRARRDGGTRCHGAAGTGAPHGRSAGAEEHRAEGYGPEGSWQGAVAGYLPRGGFLPRAGFLPDTWGLTSAGVLPRGRARRPSGARRPGETARTGSSSRRACRSCCPATPAGRTYGPRPAPSAGSGRCP